MTKEIVIINGSTGEQIQRPMTAEEIAEYEYRWRDPEEVKAEKAKAKAKSDLLEKLGITEDEAKLLLS
jgi:hypothetical protein